MQNRDEIDFSIGQETPCFTLLCKRNDVEREPACNAAQKMAENAGSHYGSLGIFGGDDELGWAIRIPQKSSPITGWSCHVTPLEICFVEGDFYEDPVGQPAANGEIAGLSEYVAEHLANTADGRIRRLIGVWSAIHVDRRSKRITVVNDLTGTRPVFWYGNDGVFIVTHSLWAFRQCSWVRPEWDAMALNQRLTIGVPLQGRTWLKGVRILTRGQRLVSDDHAIRMRDEGQYFSRPESTTGDCVERLRFAVDQMTDSVSRRVGSGLFLGLSGGLDSRILLASLLRQGINASAITYAASEQNRDAQLAERCARHCGITHHLALLDGQVARDLIPDCLILNNGESRAYGHAMLGQQAKSLGGDALLLGYAGDIFAGHPFGNFDFHKVRTVEELSKKMLQAYHTWLTADEVRLIVSPYLRVEWDELVSEWNASFTSNHDGSLQDLFIDHLLDNRLQRRTLPRLDQSRPWCVPIMAFVDERVYSAYRTLPLSEIVEEKAHLSLIRDYQTGLENIPSAAKAFLGLPLKYEYRARQGIRMLRSLRTATRSARRRLAKPTRRDLPITTSNIFDYLGRHDLYDRAGMQALQERAKAGLFKTTEVLQQLQCMTLVHDLLFNGTFPSDSMPIAVTPQSDVEWLSENQTDLASNDSKMPPR